MPYSLTGVGNVPSGGTETDVLWLPDGYQRDGTRRGVVYCHGANENAITPLAGALAFKAALAALLEQVATVYPVVSIDAGTPVDGTTTSLNNWGNANGQTRLGQAVTWLQTATTGGGAKSGTVILVGESMGHVLAMNWAQAHASSVACIVGMIPVCDLDQIRDNTLAGQISISGAWATGTWTAPHTPPLPSTANPAVHANHSNIVSTPHRMYYATDDVIAVPAAVVALQADLGAACSLVDISPGGHGAVGNIGFTDLMTFLAAHA